MYDYFLDKYFLSFYTYNDKKLTTAFLLKKREKNSIQPNNTKTEYLVFYVVNFDNMIFTKRTRA